MLYIMHYIGLLLLTNMYKKEQTHACIKFMHFIQIKLIKILIDTQFIYYLNILSTYFTTI